MKHAGSINANKTDQWEIEMEQMHSRKMCTDDGTTEDSTKKQIAGQYGTWIYEESGFIAEGSFGKVFDCHKEGSSENDDYVIKINTDPVDKDLYFSKEILALKVLKKLHPKSSIVKIVDWIGKYVGDTYEYTHFVMEKVKGETLRQIITSARSPGARASSSPTMKRLLVFYGQNGSHEREAFVAELLKQIGVKGVLLMNELEIAHRDIKPHNIMVEIDEKYESYGHLRFTLVDLGLAKFYGLIPKEYGGITERYVASRKLSEWDKPGTPGYRSDCQFDPTEDMLESRYVAYLMDIPALMQTTYMVWAGNIDKWVWDFQGGKEECHSIKFYGKKGLNLKLHLKESIMPN